MNKQKMDNLELKVAKEGDWDQETFKAIFDRIRNLELDNSACHQDRKNTQLQIQRLEELKANRETVDSFRSDLHNLKTDISDRFDKLERILENFRTNGKSNI